MNREHDHHNPDPAAGLAGFTLYTEGDELYRSMLEAIASARHHVLLESYIFADDEIGRQFAAKLIEAARAGIIVRIHIDAAGSLFWSSRNLVKLLHDNGVRVRWFHRWSWRHPLRYNRRNHRKLLVIDGKLAFTGGFNIHRENSRALFGETRWRDTHIGFSGPLASEAMELFGRFWIGRRRRTHPHPAPDGSMLLSNYARGGRRYLNGTFSAMLSRAQKTIYLSTPYFVPDRRTQRLLSEAAGRGVDVCVLVPRKSDVRLAQWAARAAYDRLLDSGVRIFEYLPRLLHSKAVVVDGSYASVGTANVDYRSIFLNYELNLFSHSMPLCTGLQDTFLEDLKNSEEIVAEQWKRRFWGGKALELAGWAARRWL